MDGLFRFLGVRPFSASLDGAGATQVHARAYGKASALTLEAECALARYYAPHNARLFAMLGVDDDAALREEWEHPACG